MSNQSQVPQAEKRKTWPWVVAGVAVIAVVLLGSLVLLLADSEEDDERDAAATAVVSYDVAGRGDMNVSFNDRNLNQASEWNQMMPWHREVTLTGVGSLASVSATAPADAAVRSKITCTISVNGKVIDTQTASGAGANVSCNYTLKREDMTPAS